MSKYLSPDSLRRRFDFLWNQQGAQLLWSRRGSRGRDLFLDRGGPGVLPDPESAPSALLLLGHIMFLGSEEC